jgi:hypothetical protein
MVEWTDIVHRSLRIESRNAAKNDSTSVLGTQSVVTPAKPPDVAMCVMNN